MSVESTSETIKKLEVQIERLDKEVFNLTSKCELLENLLLKILEDQTISTDTLTDINYIVLKKDLDAEERSEIPFFLAKLQKEHKFEGKVPSLDEVHSELLNILGIDEHEKSNYPIQISRQLIEAQTKTGVFPVGRNILEKS